MHQQARAFLAVARREGLLQAGLSAATHLSPPPLAQRLAFTKDFLQRRPSAPSSWRAQARMWYHGFLPKSYALYDVDAHGPGAYVSDLDERFGWDINEPHEAYLNDKVRFHDLLEERGFGEYLPHRFGTLEAGTVAGDDLLALLRDEGRLVVKDRTGAMGEAVHILEVVADGYAIDGRPCSREAIRAHIDDLDGYLVTAYVRQGAYAASLYPDAPNTLRIVTMHPADGAPFIARSIHRIGADAAGAVDNFSRGGLSAVIGDDGTLSAAVRYHDGTVSWHDHHPDTGARIAGVGVPGWDALRTTIRSVAAAVPEVPYVGWDVIVTDDGPRLIEGNSNTDTDLLQAHGPLLTDERVRAFYRAHGIA